MIRFTEHFDRKEDVNNLPICNFVAISSVIPEYRVYDMLLACLMDPSKYTVQDKDWAWIKSQMENKYTGSNQYAFADAVGTGPECAFISRTAYQWFLQEVLGKFLKPYQPPVQKHW
jgi:hypothetical protein